MKRKCQISEWNGRETVELVVGSGGVRLVPQPLRALTGLAGQVACSWSDRREEPISTCAAGGYLWRLP